MLPPTLTSPTHPQLLYLCEFQKVEADTFLNQQLQTYHWLLDTRNNIGSIYKSVLLPIPGVRGFFSPTYDVF